MQRRDTITTLGPNQIVVTRPLRWGGEYQQIVKMVPLRYRTGK